MARQEGNDNTRRASEGCYNYLRALTHAVEPEMSDPIIFSAQVEFCPIKYSNFEYEGKTPKSPKKSLKNSQNKINQSIHQADNAIEIHLFF